MQWDIDWTKAYTNINLGSQQQYNVELQLAMAFTLAATRPHTMCFNNHKSAQQRLNMLWKKISNIHKVYKPIYSTINLLAF